VTERALRALGIEYKWHQLADSPQENWQRSSASGVTGAVRASLRGGRFLRICAGCRGRNLFRRITLLVKDTEDAPEMETLLSHLSQKGV